MDILRDILYRLFCLALAIGLLYSLLWLVTTFAQFVTPFFIAAIENLAQK